MALVDKGQVHEPADRVHEAHPRQQREDQPRAGGGCGQQDLGRLQGFGGGQGRREQPGPHPAGLRPQLVLADGRLAARLEEYLGPQLEGRRPQAHGPLAPLGPGQEGLVGADDEIRVGGDLQGRDAAEELPERQVQGGPRPAGHDLPVDRGQPLVRETPGAVAVGAGEHPAVGRAVERPAAATAETRAETDAPGLLEGLGAQADQFLWTGQALAGDGVDQGIPPAGERQVEAAQALADVGAVEQVAAGLAGLVAHQGGLGEHRARGQRLFQVAVLDVRVKPPQAHGLGPHAQGRRQEGGRVGGLGGVHHPVADGFAGNEEDGPLEAQVGGVEQPPVRRPGRRQHVAERPPALQVVAHPAEGAGEQPVGLGQFHRCAALGTGLLDAQIHQRPPLRPGSAGPPLSRAGRRTGCSRPRRAGWSHGSRDRRPRAGARRPGDRSAGRRPPRPAGWHRSGRTAG